MEHIIIDAGTLEFSDDDLTASGLLVPYGVPARSNIGTFTFAAGDIELPTDLTGSSLNIEHAREQVVGAFSRVWEQPETGVFSAFKFRDDEAGRQAYADAKSGKRKNLSAEVANVRIQGGKALPGARLFAAAVVEHPAFAGATLLAAEDTETAHYEDTYTDDNGVTWKRVTDTTTTTTTSTTTDPEAADPADDPEEEETTTMTASAVKPGAKVPATLLAGAPTATDTTTEDQAVDLGSVFAAMAKLKTGMRDQDSETLLAALSDIKTAGAGALAGAGVLQPAWVGRLWQGRRYTRRYLDLATHTFGGIQLGGRKGFKLDQGTALVTHWAGNKADIGSGTATTSVTSSSIQAYGYAADVAREWSDLEGGAEVIQAFFEGVTDSYAKVTDLDALAAIYLVATKAAADLDRLVAPDTYPAIGDSEFAPALGMLIQGVEAIEDADDTPSYALVNPVAWKQLIYTPKDAIPEFVTFTAAAGGDASTTGANGTVFVRKAPAATFTGLDPDEPQVIVGAKAAVEFREQGETPIQVDALDIAKGGLDRAVLGYMETFVVRPESLVAIGTELEA